MNWGGGGGKRESGDEKQVGFRWTEGESDGEKE